MITPIRYAQIASRFQQELRNEAPRMASSLYVLGTSEKDAEKQLKREAYPSFEVHYFAHIKTAGIFDAEIEVSFYLVEEELRTHETAVCESTVTHLANQIAKQLCKRVP